MFKTGVIADEISQDLSTAIQLAKKYSLDAIELRSVWEKGVHELQDCDLSEIKKQVGEAGLSVCAISSPFFKCNIHRETEIADHIEILRKSIRAAKMLGASLVRGFTFWAEGAYEENLPLILKRFEEPIRILKQEEITLVLESDPSVFSANAQKLKRVIESLHSPYVKALWDPGNDIFDPDGEVPYPTGYNFIKPHIAHVHLKDAVRRSDGRVQSVPIGEGEVDYLRQLGALIADGYDGYVVLETHYRPKHEMNEELMKLPKGSAFSYLGYEATEECLEKWFAMMKVIHDDKSEF